MARIVGVDIPNEKRVVISLTYIYGIGRTTAQKICHDAKVSEDIRVKNLTEEQSCFIEEYNNELTECDSKQLWERFGRLLESDQKTAVVAFGRMNPPTIGHQKLVDKMASLAQGEKAKLFLSHTQDKKKNPLSYEQKIRYAKEAFEPKVDVVDSPARTVIEVLADLYNQCLYAC